MTTFDVTVDQGQFKVVRDTVVAFSTEAQRKSFNLVPDAAITLTGHMVTFPDLKTDVWYRTYHTTTGSTTDTGCDSFIGILGQEWGPDKSNVISDDLLGTLPVKADYIDIKVKLTRTQAPTPYLKSTAPSPEGKAGQAWPQYLPDGEWANLDGYWTLVEGINNLVQRSMEFVFDAGTGNISLRKRQSVNGSIASFLTTNSPSTYGFYYSAGNTGIVSYYLDWKESLGPIDPGGVYLPNGPQHCNMSDPTDYTSIYSMDAVITPGRISAAS
jgi:hypothetical protein